MEYTHLGRSGLLGEPAVPRHDELRPGDVGGRQPRDHGPARTSTGSTSSTPPTSTAGSTARGSPSRSSAGGSPRAAAGARRPCSPPRSTARWASGPTSATCRPSTSAAPATRRLKRLQTDYIDLYQMHHVDRDHAVGGDLAGHGDARAAGQDPLRRQLATSPAGTSPRRSEAREGAALPRARQRAVDLQPAHPLGRAGGAAGRARIRSRRHPVVAAARRPAVRRAAQGA